jgi:hypothetical protein
VISFVEPLGVPAVRKPLLSVASPPSRWGPYRDVDCLFALMPEFRGLVRLAEEAGWSADEIASSLLTLAQLNSDRPIENTGIPH